ncbi:uncharacterized Zn finger protein (UPF0148 family) [Salirhabdus euzebyi]|uniref:Uncharacterized Zn finger protein (UPF0148 family) n=1 Tax=Salirhabdus euzebyi TaxID=394506 RepID=A0A841Q7T5_9BACI|nr:hypothetical protein [Salirhabdus euzebyi]MBB6454393.1 uncharacterized Zn finger protein (UPF0148 family) [Salirhabdus euzebyi]
MNCFKCKNTHLDMVKVNDYVVVCPMCDMKFDVRHAEKTEKKLMQKSYHYMSNEPLAEQFFNYLRSKDVDINMVKYGISQWLYIGDKGLSIVRKHFAKEKIETENKLKDIKRIL